MSKRLYHPEHGKKLAGVFYSIETFYLQFCHINGDFLGKIIHSEASAGLVLGQRGADPSTWEEEQCELMCEHPSCSSVMFELVLFCYIWVSGMFYPISDINYGVIALVACNNSPLFFNGFSHNV